MSKIGKKYSFNSASQTIYKLDGTPIEIVGKHLFVKQKDSLLDKLKLQSRYLLDGKTEVYVPSGVEDRCLEEIIGEQND